MRGGERLKYHISGFLYMEGDIRNTEESPYYLLTMSTVTELIGERLGHYCYIK